MSIPDAVNEFVNRPSTTKYKDDEYETLVAHLNWVIRNVPPDNLDLDDLDEVSREIYQRWPNHKKASRVYKIARVFNKPVLIWVKGKRVFRK
jgi:hypothetical protein